MMDPRIKELKELLPRCMLYDWVRLGSRLARLLRDEHHAGRHDAILDRLLERARESAALREWRGTHRPEVRYPPNLPLCARKDEILEAIRAHQVVVIAGETGSGKTTQLPKICLDAGFGIEARIGCTQPRRMAAISVSRRIAEELNVEWGREVGCKIRFDDHSGPETFIKMMTDGMLLAEVQGDPLLSEYNVIVLDEAHERSLNIDFLLGHMKGLLARREDLKLIITSATIDTAAFSSAFDNAPVIEVSGRLFPVEVLYQPLESVEEENGDMTYVDAAVRAADLVCGGGERGDALIFMPGERDIRETCDLLESRFGGTADVIPLFGRLGSGDQQRVFAPGPRRKLIVATNIAETSLTIPGIRYVIDSGLARLSRYSPRTRTRRLPIEPISQSSANQRKGRAGRLEDGVCIRLYSEEDFSERPPFTQPEIQRSNLGEVILRLKAFHLGEIETFPFINPPSPAAIQAGYALLHELGALDARRNLTPLGQDLARLPIDPTLGRMLLQSQREHATRELLIIASGLSIQDPRERPSEQQAAADAAHRKHVDPRSDFLTLLNVWNAVHDEWESLRTQNQRRKFCRTHFLSYLRMREWQDLHAQLRDALGEVATVHLGESNAAYEAVHRSILSGLLAHIGKREDRNVYKGGGNRLMNLFPGSVLFERPTRPVRGGTPDKGARAVKPRSNQPAWIVAGEIVETSQLFARTVAGIDPQWIIELAPHLCKVTHQKPHWSARAGRVLVEEITTFSGLELRRRHVAYGNLQPKEAAEIFIRAALVSGDLIAGSSSDPSDEGASSSESNSVKSDLQRRPGNLGRSIASGRELPPQYEFLEYNRRLREKIESWQTRVRRHDLGDLDDALTRFYAGLLGDVSSRDDLNAWMRRNGGPSALHATEEALSGGRDLEFDRAAFPDSIVVGGQPVALTYAYAPGESHDGVTIRVPFTLADAVSPALIEWSVPGLREAKAEELLRSLPKALRVPLLPIAPKAGEIARDFAPSSSSIAHDLSRFVQERYGVAVPPQAWAIDALPVHLRPHIEYTDPDRKGTTGIGPRGAQNSGSSQKSVISASDQAWELATREWERFQVTQWSFGDLPERLVLGEAGGLPLFAWPGLEVEGDHVHVRLFRSQPAARAKTAQGVRRLAGIVLTKEFAWLRKDLRALAPLAPLYAALGSLEELEETAFEHLRRYILSSISLPSLTRAHFDAGVEEARRRFQGLVTPWIARLREVLELHGQIRRRQGNMTTVTAKPVRAVNDLRRLDELAFTKTPAAAPASAPAAPGEKEIQSLVPRRFLEVTSYERLTHLPRYLKALLVRLDRASVNPLKDRERQSQIAPYVEILRAFQAKPGSVERQVEIESLRWMIEEFRVSLFAQELGTAGPISARRLDQQVERIRALA